LRYIQVSDVLVVVAHFGFSIKKRLLWVVVGKVELYCWYGEFRKDTVEIEAAGDG
jgi:hypothetical protein